MLRISKPFLTRSDDGQEIMLVACVVDTDTTTNRNNDMRTEHRARYFREADGGMRSRRAVEISSGVFRLDNESVDYRVV